MYTKKFEQLNSGDVGIAGGKGASLGEMTQAGILVPPGFVILAEAFEKFLEDTDLNVEIDSVLHSIKTEKINTIEDASEKIQSLILNAEFPKDIAGEILRSFKNLGAKFVAVRSSATAEDSSAAAWAGQLESYLNTKENNLLENVKKCWASLFTPRAIFYRFEKELHKQKISVAVVVQKMVESEASGVAFSVHPITEDRNQLIVEAGFGLGEAIVAGEITPDSYVVEKDPRRIIDKNIQVQARGLYRSAKSGSEWRDLPAEIGEKQVLSDKEILKLSEIILKIENHYGFPVDIEWAMEKDKIYIVQSRSITTLGNLQREESVLDYVKGQKWFFGVRADESLLSYSLRQKGHKKYLKKWHGIEFAETLLVPLKINYPIRVFNLKQAKEFHEVSLKKILKNPKAILPYIKSNNILYREIADLGDKLRRAIGEKNYPKSIGLAKKMFADYEKSGAQFIIIFSLGLKMVENKAQLKGVKNILRQHDIWRNSIAPKEDKMGENWFYFFRFILNSKKIKFNPFLIMKYLTFREVEEWLNDKKSDEAILRIIKSRKRNGFIYLNLRNFSHEVIDDLKEIKGLKQVFLKLQKQSSKDEGDGEIYGQVTYKNNKAIKGKVIVIRDKNELADKRGLLNNKVLVAIQTTPHFIPYLKKVKAIITDEGGLTCHAAIVSREMKKPCIVGAKIATQVLKDGDLVEVDADNGVVKIIKTKRK